jgi:hypothetical protein
VVNSHNARVIAGRKGSQARSQKIYNMLREVDKAVLEAQEEMAVIDEESRIKITANYLAEKLNFSRETIYRNGYPDFFKNNFDSIIYLNKKGLIVSIESWTDEYSNLMDMLDDLNPEWNDYSQQTLD